MEPVTMIAAAVAIGASEGVRETAKKTITDAYAALRNWLGSKYGSVAAEISGLEQEPGEELRRALLAEKLAAAGANDDPELRKLAQTLLNVVEESHRGCRDDLTITGERFVEQVVCGVQFDRTATR